LSTATDGFTDSYRIVYVAYLIVTIGLRATNSLKYFSKSGMR